MPDMLTDPLIRYDLKSQELAYNNATDRMKVEFPAAGDPASSGVIGVRPELDSITKTGEYAAIQNRTVLWIPAAGSRIHLQGVMFSSSSSNSLKVESSGVIYGINTVIPISYIPASGGAVVDAGIGQIWKGNSDESLYITTTMPTPHSVLLWGYEKA